MLAQHLQGTRQIRNVHCGVRVGARCRRSASDTTSAPVVAEAYDFAAGHLGLMHTNVMQGLARAWHQLRAPEESELFRVASLHFALRRHLALDLHVLLSLHRRCLAMHAIIQPPLPFEIAGAILLMIGKGRSTRRTSEALYMVLLVLYCQDLVACKTLAALRALGLASVAEVAGPVVGLEIGAVDDALALAALEAVRVVRLVLNAQSATSDAPTTASTALRRVFDLVAVLAEHSIGHLLVVKERARYLLMAHATSEAITVVRLALGGNVLAHDWLSAASTFWSARHMATLTHHATRIGDIWAFDCPVT